MVRVTHPPFAALDPSSCQVIDTVHDAKAAIADELDRIRQRQGIPVVVDIDPGTADGRRAFATEHVERRQAAGDMTSVDPELWRDNIVHWLTPFPVDRWRRRGWSTMATHRIARERAQLEPRPETSAARAAEQRAAAAFATWAHLHDVGLARDGDEDDLVSNVLAHDLAANAG